MCLHYLRNDPAVTNFTRIILSVAEGIFTFRSHVIRSKRYSFTQHYTSITVPRQRSKSPRNRKKLRSRHKGCLTDLHARELAVSKGGCLCVPHRGISEKLSFAIVCGDEVYELAGKSKLPWSDDSSETRSGSDAVGLLETVRLSSHVGSWSC